MVDLERIKADPDPNPTFQADVDLNLNPKMLSDSEREKKFLPNLHFFLLHNLTKLVKCNFLSNNVGGGARVKG